MFTYLLQNKGSAYDHWRGCLYTAHDFDHMYFPQDWYRVYDRLSYGCEIEFPVRMCSSVMVILTVIVELVQSLNSTQMYTVDSQKALLDCTLLVVCAYSIMLSTGIKRCKRFMGT